MIHRMKNWTIVTLAAGLVLCVAGVSNAKENESASLSHADPPALHADAKKASASGVGDSSRDATRGGGATMAWQPVGATGAFNILGNEIQLIGGGQEVTLELQLSGWAPSELQAYQAAIFSSGYTSGAGDPLNPKGWPATPADGAFVDEAHPNYVFAGLSGITATNTATLDYLWGAVLWFSSQKVAGLKA